MLPQTVLLLEDDALAAEALRSDLEQLGLRVLGPASNCSQALEVLLRERPDFAILDTHLDEETCEVVIDECAALGVPVVIASGHRAEELPIFAMGFPLLAKPYLSDDLGTVVGLIA
jgi:DNA-binding response OmpR family regulator